MILHAKPIPYVIGDRGYNDWHYKGNVNSGSNFFPPEEEKEKEFFSEEEFKI